MIENGRKFNEPVVQATGFCKIPYFKIVCVEILYFVKWRCCYAYFLERNGC